MVGQRSTCVGFRLLVWVLAVWVGQCLCVGAAAASAVARLRSPATVAGPDILLGEIADIDSSDELLRERLKSLVVGKAALPGAERQLFVGSVRVRLRQAGIPETLVLLQADGDALRVQTVATLVPASELEAVAEAAVARWLESCYGAIPASIRCSAASALVAVSGSGYALRPASEVVRKPGSDQLSVPIAIWSDRRLVQQVTVTCSVTAYAEVAVAATRLERRSELRMDDIRWEARSILSLPSGALVRGSWSEATGWRLTRFVDAGSVFTTDMLERQPDAYAGAEVQLATAVGAVRVSDLGTLTADGYVGATVGATNARTGQLVRGLLVTPTMVSVE